MVVVTVNNHLTKHDLAMKLTISIHMDHAAFEDCDGRSEAARILEVVARKLEQGTDSTGEVYDINGNNVGCWKITGKQLPNLNTPHTPGQILQLLVQRDELRAALNGLLAISEDLLPHAPHEQINGATAAYQAGKRALAKGGK